VISSASVASRVDGGQFVLEDQGIVIAAVIMYINDNVIIANNGLIAQMKDQMKARSPMHELWRVSCYLGMNIERIAEHHTIDMHQHSYIWKILAKFRM